MFVATPDSRAGHRIVFANQLRGLAALCVVVDHFIDFYLNAPNVVSAATQLPTQPGETGGLFYLAAHHWLHFGPFGVAVFFLISGLVIPLSLERYNGATFLLARIFRIYPTYLATLCLGIGVVWASTFLWGKSLYSPVPTLLANALLLNDVFGLPSIDLVNWTLCIELKFYLLMALAAPAVRRGSVAILFLIAVGALMATVAVNAPALAPAMALLPSQAETFVRMIVAESLYLIFMLVGVLFSYHLRGIISGRALLGSASLLSAIFAVCWRQSVLAPSFADVAPSYAFALLVFSLLFAARKYVRNIRLLDGLAAVSYPLYLVHPLVGFSLLRVLTVGCGMRYALALAVTFPAVIVLAALTHVAIERWSIAAGHRIAQRGAAASRQGARFLNA